MKTKKNLVASSFSGIMLILIILLSVSSCGKTNDPNSDKDIAYTTVDQMPVYTGGDSTLMKFIAMNTRYPEDAKQNNIQGKVIVKFIVGKDGAVTNAEVLKGVNPSLDAEAVRVVSSLPKFEKPGILNGKAVSVNFMIPIQFTLK